MGAGDSSGPATMPRSYVEAVKPLSEARAADWENYLASKAANPKPAKEEPNPNSVYFEDMVLQGLIEPKPPEPSAEELRAVIDKYEAKPPSEVFGTDDPAEQLMAAVMGFREDLVIKLCAAKAPTNFVDEVCAARARHRAVTTALHPALLTAQTLTNATCAYYSFFGALAAGRLHAAPHCRTPRPRGDGGAPAGRRRRRRDQG